MAKRLSKRRKTKADAYNVGAFNGVAVVERKAELKTFYEDTLDEFYTQLRAGETDYPSILTFAGDVIKLRASGKLFIDGTEFFITRKAFGQILSLVGLPFKFCMKMKPPMLVDVFNKTMMDNYERNFSIKLSAEQVPSLIIGVFPQKQMILPQANSLISSLLKPKAMKERGTSFMAGVVDDLTYAVYLVFDEFEDFDGQSKKDFKGEQIWPGVEILFSPIWEVKPTTTACVISQKYAALNKNRSFRIEPKQAGIHKVLPIMETHIRNVQYDVAGMARTFKDSFDTKISKETNDVIQKRLPKVLNSSFSTKDFTDKDMSEFFSTISEFGANKTLEQRRKILFFVWDILQ